MSNTLTMEKRDSIFNEVILETMIVKKNQIIELQKKEEILGEEYMKIAEEYCGREKPHRIALSKVRGVQNEISELEADIVRLFMNYRETK